MSFDEKDTYFDTFSTCYHAHRNELWGNPLFASRQEAISSSVLFQSSS
ncbi:hypothetical protein SAMN04488090_4984 [Siphonobacter aquaeclarae]|uniref:Uncharacterized protein n=1 Tax=Siphonobacter aquaeclarae TaxID=563176 RepID=A0A1G9YLK2_9BACT|nr:hypothetical protein SAMN04488090_4984 [Siphonobacter aquaeclarae]